MLGIAPRIRTKHQSQQLHNNKHHRLQLCSNNSSTQGSRNTTTTANNMSACLVLLPGTLSQSELLPFLREAHSQYCSRVYVSIQGVTEVNQALLQWLGQLYAAVGEVDPRWDVVPCFECAGWSQDKLKTLTDSQLLLAPASLQTLAEALLQELNSSSSNSRAGGGPAVQLQVLQAAANSESEQQQQQQQQQQEARHQDQHKGGSTDWQQQRQQQDDQSNQQQQRGAAGQLQFAAVAVGGTFDRLHAGHRLLLAATALVATHRVYAGITADNLLAKKSNKHLLQDYGARRAAAVDFMALVHPALVITDGPLTDPQEPTQAELDPAMQALVVSAETLTGGQAINEGRKARGFQPVQLVVVGLVGGSDAASKLSSTALRQADAADPTPETATAAAATAATR